MNMKGETKLKRAIRRLHTAIVPLGTPLRDVDPPDAWAHHLDDRLRLVEQKISDQNRLLLIAFISMIADLAYRLLAP